MVHPYRMDHVGSLLRPKRLLDAREASQAGKLPLESLRKIEDESIIDVIALQRSAGIAVVTDGEFRRMSWMAAPYECLEGLERTNESRFNTERLWKGVGEKEANEETPVDWAFATAKLKLKKRLTGGETPFLKAHAGGPYKITLPAPTMFLPLYREGLTNRVYPTTQDMLDDLVRIYQSEVDAAIADGASYVQLDSLRYAQAIGGFSPDGTEDMSDLDAILTQTIDSDNAVLSRAKAKNIIRGIHICRGNHRSAWVMSGSYDRIAERLLNEVDTDRFLLEYDDERSGSFEPLRFLPKGKIAVLGLVTTKVGKLESEEALMRRIDEAARFAPLDQLAIGPQCGFASTSLGNLLTEDEEKRKLELVCRVARRVWN